MTVPSDLSGLVGWWKASAITGVADGGAVSSWPDSSASGITLAQADSSRQPTYRATGDVNGGPTVEFDGTADWLQAAYSATLNPAAMTLLVKCKVTGGAGAYRGIVASRDFAGANMTGYLLYASSANVWEGWIGVTSAANITVPGGNVTTNLWETIALKASSTGGSRMWTSGTIGNARGNYTAPQSAQPFRVGAGANESASGDFFAPVQITEIVLYNRELTEAELGAVQAYLGTRCVHLTNTSADAAVTVGSGTKHKADYSPGAASTLRNVNTVAGSTTGVQLTDSTTAGTNGNPISWYTPPLKAVTIAGQIVAVLWGMESSNSANAAPAVLIERCSGDGTVLSTIAARTPSQAGTEFATTAGGAGKTCTVTAANVADTTLANGDRLRITLWIDDAADQGGTGTMASGFNTQMWVNGAVAGAGRARFTFTEILTEYSAPTNVAGNAAVTLPSLTTSSSGSAKATASLAATLPSFTAAAAAAATVSGAIAVTLPGPGASAAGAATVTGTISLTLPALAAATQADLTVEATVAAALPPLAAAYAAAVADQQAGTIDAVLPHLDAELVAAGAITAAAAAVLPSLAAAYAAAARAGGDAHATLPGLQVAHSGAVSVTSVIAGTLPPLAAAAAGQLATPGHIDAGLPAIVAGLTGFAAGADGLLSLALPTLVGALEARATVAGAVAAAAPALAAHAAGTVADSPAGELTAPLPSLTAAATARVTAAGQLAATFPTLQLAASGSVDSPPAADLEVTLPPLTVQLAGQVETSTLVVTTGRAYTTIRIARAAYACLAVSRPYTGERSDMAVSIPADSVEYLKVDVTSTRDLTGYPVEAALMPASIAPDNDDWQPAEWATGQPTVQLLVGPGDPGRYRFWVRFLLGAETPVRRAGLVYLT